MTLMSPINRPINRADISLDDAQKRAVSFVGRRLRVTGGPATGKTTALLERAAHLVEDRGIDPAGILIFVGDRRHAVRLRDALVRRLERSMVRPSVHTFHGFAWWLLTRAFTVETPTGPESDLGYELALFDAEPMLLTAFDQRAFVGALLRAEDPEDWPVNGNLLRSNAFAGEVRDFLLRVKERLLTRRDVERLAEERGRRDWLELAAFYEKYTNHLESGESFDDGRPRLDFAMVLESARRLIGEHPAVAADLRHFYPHVLVDDFEEANRAESALLQALLPEDDEPDRSAVVFGDPAGTVFTFRGADPACLEGLSVEDSVELATQYRNGRPAQVNLYSHLTEEARAAVAALRQHHADGLPWGTMGIVLRDYHKLLAPLRRELHRAGVPYRVEGEALGLADDPGVKPVLDLFSIACGRVDSENLWPGVLSSDIGGLSSTELIELRRSARLSGIPVHEICARDRLPEGLPASVARKVHALCSLVSKAREWAERLRPDDCFWRLWQEAEPWGSMVAAGDDRRLDSLTTLADALGRFSDRHGSGARIVDFIDTLVSAEFTPESVRLIEPTDAVTITTAHGAKSTEFAFAVVAGCVEGLWPDPARRGVLLETDLLGGERDHADRLREALAEEERLFRLATSRAPSLVLSGLRAGGSDRTRAEPSRFLEQFGFGIPESNALVPDLLLTTREAEVAWRRTMCDEEEAPAARVAAAWGLANLPHLDTDRWWWGRDWTQNSRPVVGEKKRTSYSRFSDYENCPLQYLLKQVLGLDPETSYHMAYGSLMHRVLEKAENGELPKTFDALWAEAQQLWRDDAYPPGAISDFLQRDCREIIKRYVELEANNGHKTIATEQNFEFDINDWTVRGKIDRIDECGRDGIRLIDYKTSNSYKWDEEAKTDLQLATYFLACARNDELSALGDAKTAELLYLRHVRGNQIRRATQMPKKADDGTPWVVVTEQRISEMLEGIEAERFAPSPEAECRFCKFKPLCPMWPQGEEMVLR
jgi:superfamily I DNA/RNA helicase/RecB family exonuclease